MNFCQTCKHYLKDNEIFYHILLKDQLIKELCNTCWQKVQFSDYYYKYFIILKILNIKQIIHDENGINIDFPI